MVTLGFPDGSDDMVKNLCTSAGDVRDMGLIPGSGRSAGERNGKPLQYSCLGNPLDKGAWQAAVHGVTKKSDTTKRLNNNDYRGKGCEISYKIPYIRLTSKPTPQADNQ